ncbi:hypothetical protein N9A49_04395 [Salibacteraceae bacterium]|nr:hypothetical protein [Salibacteraceae bacterium]
MRNKVVSKINGFAEKSKGKVHVLFLGQPNSEFIAEFDSTVNIHQFRKPMVNSKVLRLPIFYHLLFEKKYELLYKKAYSIIESINPEFVILRDSLGSKQLKLFCASIAEKSKLIFELNSDLLAEYEMLNQRNSASAWSQISLEKEAKWKKKTLNHGYKFISVSAEIGEVYQKRYSLDSAKFKVISNGIDYNKRVLAEFPTQFETIRCIFLAGGGDSYYKIERMIKSLEPYRGARKIELSIVGIDKTDVHESSYSINYYSKVPKSELNQFMMDTHIGISTLGLYKKKLNKASTLKVREYLMAGIPVLLGYDDNDIPSNCPFVMNVSNSEELVDLDLLVRYVDRVYQNKSIRSEISDFFQSSISSKSKINELFDVLYDSN